MSLTKEKAIRIVFQCVYACAKELEKRNLIFICIDKHKRISVFETAFHDYNFQHLTGLETPPSLSAQQFYQACIHRRLSVDDFEFHTNGTSELKLSILPLLVNKNLGPARFMGTYNNRNPLLITDRVTGSVKGGVGFVRNGGVGSFVPNTLLNGDMRQYISDMRRIILTCRKGLEDNEYTEIVYSAKKVDWDSIQLPDSCRIKRRDEM